MSRTTTGHPLRQRIAKSLFILLCVSFLSVLAGCSDNDRKAVNAVPVLASVSPASVTAGGAAFTLTATGSGFQVTSAVHWNGAARPTTFVSTSQLTAAIPATDVAMAGTAQVTVVTPAPGGGTSSAMTFTIQSPNAVPVLASVSPASATVGGAAFTLNATGSGFQVTSAVYWNGAARPTTFVSTSQLTAAIPATDLAMAGTAQVTVVTPAPGGGTSSAVTFTIQSPPASTGTAEGWWKGTSSTGRSLEGLVLGSGEYWFIYSAVNNSAVIAGLSQGNGTSQNGRFTSSNGIDFNFEGAGNSPVTVDATYVEEKTFNGAVKYTGTTNELTFTTNYYFDYRLPSQAPPLGPWITTTFSGTSYSSLTEYTEMTIASSGELTGVSASGCRFAGTIAPSTEANYYNVTVTFQGGACVNGTGTVAGIALFDFYPRRLTSAAVNSTRTSGYLFVGTAPW